MQLSPLPIQQHQLCLKHRTWISLHLERTQGTTTKESEGDPRQLVPKHLTPSLPLSTWDVLRVLDLIQSMTFEPPLVYSVTVSYTHLRAHETRHDLVCRLLLE